MTPLSFEWQWGEPGYYIFFGLLYLALTIVGSGTLYAVIRTWLDLMKGDGEDSSPKKIDQRLKYTDY